MQNTRYPKAKILLENINENIKIQTQNMNKNKKIKSK
jgi:hypothetical protein